MKMPTRIINGFNSVKVQIEQQREDVAVPDGIAISNGMYDKDLSYDLPDSATVPMAMNKNGNQTLPYDTWQDITGWVARSGFTGTVISNNGLVVGQDQRAKISVRLALVGGIWVNYSSAVRILVNGAVVKTSSSSTTTLSGSHTLDVKAGDVIKIQAWTKFYSLVFGFRNNLSVTLSGGANSYVSFAKAKPGVIDFANDLVFAEKTRIYESGTAVYVMPDGKQQTLGMSRVTATWSGSTSTDVDLTKKFGEDYITNVKVTASPSGSNNLTKYTAVNLGPILAQSKIPYPVEEGMLLNFGGTLYVRRTGTQERTEEDLATGMNVRFSVWGKGKTSDEYGEHDLDIELAYYEGALQSSSSSPGRAMVTYTVPAQANDVVVPANIDQVYFVATLKQTAVGEYASGTFENNERAGTAAAYFGTSNADPLFIKVELPQSEQNTYRHPLSATGVALKNRKYFDNMSRPKALTFFGNNSAVTLDIYRSSNKVRGSLIGTWSASAGERKTITVESNTGQIELVSANPFWVESCKAINYDSLSESQTTLERIEWSDVSDPVNNIIAVRNEYGISKLQIAFVSDELADSSLLMPGKRVRLLMNHYGSSRTANGTASYNTIFTGMIRDYRVKFDYLNEPFIELVVEDAHRALTDTDGRYLYDLPIEYGPMLNGLGESAFINGVEVSGSWKNKTDSAKNQPSAFVDGMKVEECFAAVRNSNKGFVYVDRFNAVQYKQAVSVDPKLILSDRYASGDISYSRLDKGTDTEEVINQVKPSEYRLDLEELKDRTVDSELPADIEPIQTFNETSQWWYDQQSIRSFGPREANFTVVRGTGKMEDIRNEELGPGFHDWADAIMDDYVLAKNKISRVMIIPDNFYDLKRLSELDIFDAVKIIWKNEQHTCFIRKMEWSFVDNHVRLELYFTRESLGVAWTPVVETIVSTGYQDVYVDRY
ncbi:hypothetical protein BH92_15405 [Rhodococcoides fascians A21d2]|uniref:hypothetical protein n=1 Tax=Rhodococcoides fascians TaxID=1828 RepID=UPI000A4EF705|nr:hypothetical protein [Rhodococcus fascians]QII01076.1 hypothetical protein BH92_15405 [Rhodococcus fascians A21d2]